MQGRVGETREAMADLQTTVLADRVVDPGADWSPEVWLIDAAAADDDLAALEQVLAGVAAAGRSTVAVVARAEGFAPAGGAVIDVAADGTLSLPALLGEQRVDAAGMDPEALRRLLELFDRRRAVRAARADARPGSVGPGNEHGGITHPGGPDARHRRPRGRASTERRRL